MVPSCRLRAAIAGAACLVACAGKSSDPPPSNSNASLHCLATLDSYCCGSSDAGGPSCVASFAAASECGAWPAGAKVHVYPSVCQGMTAVRVDGQWSTFYVYDGRGALVAIADNAASEIDPRDTTIECGAGSASFTVPVDCGDAWLSTTGAQSCSGGATGAAPYCGSR
jgi:YD repeat-containing protein